MMSQVPGLAKKGTIGTVGNLKVNNGRISEKEITPSDKSKQQRSIRHK